MRKTLFLVLTFLPLTSIVSLAQAGECPPEGGCVDDPGFSVSSGNNQLEVKVWNETVIPGEPGGPAEGELPPSSTEIPEPAPTEEAPSPAEIPQAEPSGNEDSIQIDPKSAFNSSVLSLFATVDANGCPLWVALDPRTACITREEPESLPEVDMQPYNWNNYPGTDTKTLISSASTMVTLDGAGLEVAPFFPRDQFTNIHTVVYTTRHEVTKTVRLYGKDITIIFRPTFYVYNFNDGTEPLRTTSPGHPWPDMDLIHYYKEPVPTVTEYVTLTTTWSATTRNP